MAFHDEYPFADLSALYEPLLAKLKVESTACHARVRQLEEAIQEAETWSSRRAARQARDRACYRLGAALEPTGGLAVDDVFLSGLDLLGGHGVALLAAAAASAPEGASLSELMLRLAWTDAGKVIRAWGVWSRFTWLRDLYRTAVLAFENSVAGRNPLGSWRRDPPTARQAYLAVELARFLQVAKPELANKGEAHDWLHNNGGKPRCQP